MKKWLIGLLIALCVMPMTACKNDGDSSGKKPNSTSSSVGAIELPEDKFD